MQRRDDQATVISPLRSALAGGFVYFGVVFLFAFLLGALRVTAVEPEVGAVTATLMELPIVLAASWFACSRIVRKFDVCSLGQSLLMGGSAFMLLMAAEAVLAVAVFKRPLPEYLGSFLSVAGGLGLAGQITFGLIPAFNCRGRGAIRSRQLS